VTGLVSTNPSHVDQGVIGPDSSGLNNDPKPVARRSGQSIIGLVSTGLNDGSGSVSGGPRVAGLLEDPQDEDSRGTSRYDGLRGEEGGNITESAGHCSRGTDGLSPEGRIGFLSPAKREPEKRSQGSPITPTILPVRELRNRQAKKKKAQTGQRGGSQTR